MAENTGRTFTEGEAYALVEDAVKRETAAATERVTAAEAENTGLKNRIDVLETEKAAEAQRAELAEKALTDFKAEIEAEKAREALRADRLAKVAEANPLLPLKNEDGTPHERADRIVAMTDEVFEGYLADLREVASKAPKAEDTKTEAEKAADKGLPRESAAFKGDEAGSTTKTGPVTALIGARRGLKSA